MEDLNKKEGFSRRGFLKTAAAVGAALAVSPALDKVQAATRVAAGSKAASAGDAKAATITAHRTLGTGKAAFEVSALGFGVMGMRPTTAVIIPTKSSASACCTKR